MAQRIANRLITEKSPYLLQHAYNPVDWHPWGDDAFSLAARENKPIFLSIGYATCHWCHVMERESFEDPEVAALMNQAFVSIKVDREERPDLDHVYMTVCQMLTGSGGWPLSIVMTPDKTPFFAGTYIPKTSRFGRTGMIELIPRIRQVWQTRQGEVLKSAEQIIAALRQVEDATPGQEPGPWLLEKGAADLARRFDEENGGFGAAPKFPSPHNLLFLLRWWKRSGDAAALAMVEKTLMAMRMGGVYDHIGYGFHRYATDRTWLLPHFEKMLYDQALLAMAYTEAFQATGKPVYRDTAMEVFAYVLRDMTAPDGGFYSAEDADSEGVEGKFYLWHEAEIRQILAGPEADLCVRVFNVKRDGNFQDEATGRKTGENILHLNQYHPEIAEELGMPECALKDRLKGIRERLFQVREKRSHPYKDDKILTDWNGLMMAALAKGSRAFGESGYAVAAQKAAALTLSRMQRPDGRLLHRYRDGEAGIDAHLDDYAFFVWGLLELYQATFETRYLREAIRLNQDMLIHFQDPASGGLFFTPDHGETLILRKKEFYDGAIPSGNAVAMMNLVKLARMTGDPLMEAKAGEMGRAFSGRAAEAPAGLTHFLSAVDLALGPSMEVVIVGSSGDPSVRAMFQALDSLYLPNHVVLHRPSGKPQPEIDRLAPSLKAHVPVEGKATAYVCRNKACKAPVTDVEGMMRLLGGHGTGIFPQ